MTPITRRDEAKESGYAQVREAMLSFEGDVIAADFDLWGTGGIGDDGKPLPQKEFLEVKNINVKVLTVTEELAMPVEEWNFRVNCSDFKGSFWVEAFLASADTAKVLIPDGILGKRVLWEKQTMTWDIKGVERSYTNYTIKQILGNASGGTAPAVVTPAPAPAPVPVEEVVAESAPTPAPHAAIVAAAPSDVDPDVLLVLAADLAVGKTEAQFRSAAGLHPSFVNSPLLGMVKAGAITQGLVDQGKLVRVKEGNTEVYAKA